MITLEPPTPLLPIRNLIVNNGDFAHHPAERRSLQLHLLRLVDTATLRTCTIVLSPADYSVVDRLTEFANLSQLTVVINVDEEDNLPMFERLLAAARGLLSLRVLVIAAHRATSVDIGRNSGTSLLQFLSSGVPRVSQMRFTDFHVRRDGPLPRFGLIPAKVVALLQTEVLDEGAAQPTIANFFLTTVGEEEKWTECSR